MLYLTSSTKTEAFIQTDSFEILRMGAQTDIRKAQLARFGNDLLQSGAAITLAALSLGDHQPADPQSIFFRHVHGVTDHFILVIDTARTRPRNELGLSNGD